MKGKIVCDYECHAERRREPNEEAWIVLPMERITGQSEKEMAENWKTFIIEMGRKAAPDLLRQQKTEAKRMSDRSPWLLYWLLPQILKRVVAGRNKGIWIRNYDLPLLFGLKGGFGRYSTELVSAVAEACAEVSQDVPYVYFTGRLPFPLYRIGLGDPKGKGVPDEQRKECVRCILKDYFRRKGKESWREWLAYFDKKEEKKPRLNSETVDNLEQWKALVYYTGLEEEMPALIQQLLGENVGPLANLLEAQWSRDIWRMLSQMGNRWNCGSIEEMEQLLEILIFCQEPEGDRNIRKRGRPNPHQLVFINDQADGTQTRVKLSVKN